MPDKILLVHNAGADGAAEMVTAFNHAYKVEDSKFVLVDPSPYLQERDEKGEISKPGELHVDAARDATEICRLVDFVDVGGLRQAIYRFRAASPAEVDEYKAAHSPAESKPANKPAESKPA